MSRDDPTIKADAAAQEDETSLRKLLTTLDVQKKTIESEADAILHELTNPPSEGIEPMGLDTPLVDADGYPRGDIDVYRARSQRNRFRHLQTDHKEIKVKIEGLLDELAKKKDASKEKAQIEEKNLRLAPKPKPKFDAATGKWVVKNWDGSVAGVNGGEQISFNDLTQNRDISAITEPSRTTVPAASVDESTSDTRTTSTTSRRPFAKVDGVTHPSPAADAGMKVNDLIIRFGPLHADNNDRLRAVATLVPGVAEVNGKIQISVLRRRQQSTSTSENNNVDYNDETQWEQAVLILHPRPFDGRGVLGCHIVPF